MKSRTHRNWFSVLNPRPETTITEADKWQMCLHRMQQFLPSTLHHQQFLFNTRGSQVSLGARNESIEPTVMLMATCNFPIVFQHTSHVGMWICCEFTPFVGLSFSGVMLHERTDPEIFGSNICLTNTIACLYASFQGDLSSKFTSELWFSSSPNRVTTNYQSNDKTPLSRLVQKKLKVMSCAWVLCIHLKKVKR